MSAGVALTNFTLTLDNLVVGWGIGYPEIFKKGGCPQIREGVYLSGFPTLVGREDAMETVAPRDGGLVEEEVDDQSMQDNTGCNGDKEKNSPQQSFETLDRPNTEENWRREIFEKHKMHQIEEKMLIPFKYGFSRKVTISRSRIRIKYKHEELNKTSLYPKHVRKLLEEHPDRFQGLICENFNFNQQIFNLPGEHITYCSTEKQGEAKGKQNGPFKRSKSMPGMSMKRSKKDSSNLDAEDFNSEDEFKIRAKKTKLSSDVDDSVISRSSKKSATPSGLPRSQLGPKSAKLISTPDSPSLSSRPKSVKSSTIQGSPKSLSGKKSISNLVSHSLSLGSKPVKSSGNPGPLSFKSGSMSENSTITPELPSSRLKSVRARLSSESSKSSSTQDPTSPSSVSKSKKSISMQKKTSSKLGPKFSSTSDQPSSSDALKSAKSKPIAGPLSSINEKSTSTPEPPKSRPKSERARLFSESSNSSSSQDPSSLRLESKSEKSIPIQKKPISKLRPRFSSSSDQHSSSDGLKSPKSKPIAGPPSSKNEKYTSTPEPPKSRPKSETAISSTKSSNPISTLDPIIPSSESIYEKSITMSVKPCSTLGTKYSSLSEHQSLTTKPPSSKLKPARSKSMPPSMIPSSVSKVKKFVLGSATSKSCSEPKTAGVGKKTSKDASVQEYECKTHDAYSNVEKCRASCGTPKRMPPVVMSDGFGVSNSTLTQKAHVIAPNLNSPLLKSILKKPKPVTTPKTSNSPAKKCKGSGPAQYTPDSANNVPTAPDVHALRVDMKKTDRLFADKCLQEKTFSTKDMRWSFLTSTEVDAPLEEQQSKKVKKVKKRRSRKERDLRRNFFPLDSDSETTSICSSLASVKKKLVEIQDKKNVVGQEPVGRRIQLDNPVEKSLTTEGLVRPSLGAEELGQQPAEAPQRPDSGGDRPDERNSSPGLPATGTGEAKTPRRATHSLPAIVSKPDTPSRSKSRIPRVNN